jgi:hypothetical protein
MTTYTLVAYRADSTEWCRGHAQESHASDFVYEELLTREELIEKVALLKSYEHPECPWETYNDIHWFETPAVADPEDILASAQTRAVELARERTEEKERSARAKKAAARSAQVRAEQAELARLKAKYDAPPWDGVDRRDPYTGGPAMIAQERRKKS